MYVPFKGFIALNMQLVVCYCQVCNCFGFFFFAFICRQIEEKRDYLIRKGYDQEVVDFEVHKVRQPHPLLSNAVGSPAFLSVSPSFTSQSSASPVALFHVGGEESFDAAAADAVLAKSPLHMDTLRASKHAHLEDFKDLLKYVDFTAHSSCVQFKADVKKSLNELRQEQETKWENSFDGGGSSVVASSVSSEYPDLNQDNSASNSRKSSVDLCGSMNSLPELLRNYQQYQAHFSQQQSHPSLYHSQPPSNQHQIPSQTYNPFYAGQFPFSINPFGGFQTFPSSSQQAVYQQAGLAAGYNQLLGGAGAFTVQGFQSQPAMQDSARQTSCKSSGAVPGIPNSAVPSTVNQFAATSPSIQPVMTSATAPSVASSNPVPAGEQAAAHLTQTNSQQFGQAISG